MLRFNSVNFSYAPDSEPVLRGIDLKIECGERVAVMGGNGSGKTTLALIAAGILDPTSGTVDRDPAESPAGVVFQNPDNQIISITVEHELAFPLECRQVPPAEIRREVDDTLARFGMQGQREKSPGDLSGGEKQKLALAAAIIARPGLLILDEPTSHLDAKGRELLHNAVDGIRKDGHRLAILMVTQSPDEALEFDRLIVLKYGRIVTDDAPSSIFGRSDTRKFLGIGIPNAMLVKRIDDSRITVTDSTTPHAASNRDGSTELLSIHELSFRWSDGRQVFSKLNLGIAHGKIIGLAAGSGEGKTTLGYVLAGLIRQSEGYIKWHGENQSPQQLIRKVACLFQFPERQIFADTVRNEVAFGLRQTGIPGDEADIRVESALAVVGLPYRQFADRSPHLLSGGEQRKVALASIIALERPLVFYDEPTAELDIESVGLLKRSLYAQRSSARTQVIASHDVDFLFEVCDDFVILAGGEVVFCGGKYELLDVGERFPEWNLHIPALIQLCRSDGFRALVRENRIASVDELIDHLKLIA